LFSFTTKYFKLSNWHNSSGIFPNKLFLLAEKVSSKERLPNEGGIPPVK